MGSTHWKKSTFMREIKFKIWNSHSRIMFEPYRYKNGKLLLRMWDGMIVDVYEGEKREELKEYDREHLVPLQFTGLKDKNGNEIYEGDIIKTSISKTEVGEIYFEDGAFRVRIPLMQESVSTMPLESYFIKLNAIEVIGNVWENPELLNKGERV